MTIKKNKPATYRKFKDSVIEKLRDPGYAKNYLQIAIEDYEQDRDSEEFLLALRDVAEAQGGISRIASQVGVARSSLYKTLSSKGNPRLDTLMGVLHALDFKLAIVSRERGKKKTSSPSPRRATLAPQHESRVN